MPRWRAAQDRPAWMAVRFLSRAPTKQVSFGHPALTETHMLSYILCACHSAALDKVSVSGSWLLAAVGYLLPGWQSLPVMRHLSRIQWSPIILMYD